MPYQDKAAQREYQRRWVAQRRAEFLADKACAWCGSIDSLELHHADPNKKVSHAIWSWGRERRLNEIAKCVVICRSCHERAHAEARRVEAELRYPCGTVQSYKRGCRCDACRKGNRDYQRGRKRAAA